MDYNATGEFLKNNNNKGPKCPHCDREMKPHDDHGTFKCFCDIGVIVNVTIDINVMKCIWRLKKSELGSLF